MGDCINDDTVKEALKAVEKGSEKVGEKLKEEREKEEKEKKKKEGEDSDSD